ncbi:heavy-metal-associated domain-containing protein [Streptomyces sp. NPDC057494]|uniref:heavy-metal-associated domain-containing protein n=1 Tax=Streptomyces sp. NPDC057494 TaxID=3346148 RepID=UPI00367FB8AB
MSPFGFIRRNKKSPATGEELVLSVEGMHCAGCGLLIDDELEELPGVRSSRTDVRGGRTVVRLDDGVAAMDAAVLGAAVRSAGDYTARLAD